MCLRRCMMGNKREIKWRLIWTAYLLVAISIAIPIVILHITNMSFEWIADKMGKLKNCLITRYKSEEE